MSHSVRIYTFAKPGFAVCLVLFWLLAPARLLAHDPGLSTATIQLKETKLEATLGFSLTDASQIVKMDKDQDGRITKAELAAGVCELQRQASQALEITFDDQPTGSPSGRCESDEMQNVTVFLTFPAKPFSRLVIRSKWLKV